MTILDEGVNRLRDLLSSDLDEGDWGTGTTSEKQTDTGLETEVASLEVSTTNATRSKAVNITAVLPSTSGNGSSISEHVVRHSDGTDWSRVTYSPISKTSSKEIHDISTFVFNQR